MMLLRLSTSRVSLSGRGIKQSNRKFGSTSALRDKVGFIGVGNMGGHMALNLARAGHKLIVYDTNQEAIANLQKKRGGVVTVSSPKEVAELSDAVVTMLPSSPHVQQVYLDKDTGLLAGARNGTLMIDTSTIDPNISRQVAEEVEKAGCAMVDAPVSGGVGGAEKATLTFMVGAKEGEFRRARKLLEHMGKNVVHCGGNGNGQVVKVCNNLVLAISMIGVSEAMNLGVKLGMEPKLMASIFNTSSARCWTSDTYNPVPGVMEGVPASRDYEGGFGVDLMKKDLGLAVAASQKEKIPLLLGNHAYEAYQMLSEAGFGKKDFGAVYKFLENFDQS